MFGLKKRKLLGKAVLVLFSIVVFFIGLEIVARAMVAQQSAYVLCAYEGDDLLGWKLQERASINYVPGSREYEHLVHTNSRGERGDEIEIGQSETLILGIGDSFAFGLGVEENETYLRLLEKSLKEKGKNVKALNAAVNGYSTLQELQMLNDYAENFDIDLVVLGFFSGNDVYGNIESNFRYNVVNGCLQAKPPLPTESRTFTQSIRDFLSANFKSYGFFAEKIRAVPVLREILMELGLMQGKRAPPHLQALQKEPDDFMEYAWAETEAQFELADKIAAEHGFKIAVLDIPSMFQVKDGLREQALGAYGVPLENYEYNYPETRAREIIEGKENLIFIETLTEFRASPELLYYKVDPHWTKDGHKFAAEILERELLEKGLV